MITYSWDFPAFDCYPNKAGYNNVVFLIHWRYNAVDDNGHSAIAHSTQSIAYNDGDSFVPFADLTPEIVAGWIEAAMGPAKVAALQAELAAQIDQQVNPTQITLPAPWQPVE